MRHRRIGFQGRRRSLPTAQPFSLGHVDRGSSPVPTLVNSGICLMRSTSATERTPMRRGRI
jgi:hypothetical protein